MQIKEKYVQWKAIIRCILAENSWYAVKKVNCETIACRSRDTVSARHNQCVTTANHDHCVTDM